MVDANVRQRSRSGRRTPRILLLRLNSLTLGTSFKPLPISRTIFSVPSVDLKSSSLRRQYTHLLAIRSRIPTPADVLNLMDSRSELCFSADFSCGQHRILRRCPNQAAFPVLSLDLLSPRVRRRCTHLFGDVAKDNRIRELAQPRRPSPGTSLFGRYLRRLA